MLSLYMLTVKNRTSWSRESDQDVLPDPKHVPIELKHRGHCFREAGNIGV